MMNLMKYIMWEYRTFWKMLWGTRSTYGYRNPEILKCYMFLCLYFTRNSFWRHLLPNHLTFFIKKRYLFYQQIKCVFNCLRLTSNHIVAKMGCHISRYCKSVINSTLFFTVQGKWSPDDELPESSKHVESEWRLPMKIKDSPQVTSCWLFLNNSTLFS